MLKSRLLDNKGKVRREDDFAQESRQTKSWPIEKPLLYTTLSLSSSYIVASYFPLYYIIFTLRDYCQTWLVRLALSAGITVVASS